MLLNYELQKLIAKFGTPPNQNVFHFSKLETQPLLSSLNFNTMAYLVFKQNTKRRLNYGAFQICRLYDRTTHKRATGLYWKQGSTIVFTAPFKNSRNILVLICLSGWSTKYIDQQKLHVNTEYFTYKLQNISFASKQRMVNRDM